MDTQDYREIEKASGIPRGALLFILGIHTHIPEIDDTYEHMVSDMNIEDNTIHGYHIFVAFEKKLRAEKKLSWDQAWEIHDHIERINNRYYKEGLIAIIQKIIAAMCATIDQISEYLTEFAPDQKTQSTLLKQLLILAPHLTKKTALELLAQFRQDCIHPDNMVDFHKLIEACVPHVGTK